MWYMDGLEQVYIYIHAFTKCAAGCRMFLHLALVASIPVRNELSI